MRFPDLRLLSGPHGGLPAEFDSGRRHQNKRKIVRLGSFGPELPEVVSEPVAVPEPISFARITNEARGTGHGQMRDGAVSGSFKEQLYTRVPENLPGLCGSGIRGYPEPPSFKGGKDDAHSGLALIDGRQVRAIGRPRDRPDLIPDAPSSIGAQLVASARLLLGRLKLLDLFE